MSDWMEYIVTITAAALLVSVLRSLAGDGSMGKLVKLIAGIFMALTILSPVRKLKLPDVNTWMSSFASDGREAAARGQQLGREERETFIKAQTEAYILDKAAGYGAALEVQVTLDDAGIPASVTLTGAVSPYAKACLMRLIASDLGMEQEVQQWIS